MLSGKEIARQVKLGNIVIDPFDESRLGPNSYNLRLGDRMVYYEGTAACPPRGEHQVTGTHAFVLEQPPASARGQLLAEYARVFDEPPAGAVVLDMKKDNPAHEFAIGPEGVILLPGRLYLGATVEYTETRGFVPCIEGRSSVGRLGMSIHLTAGFGDDGFCGTFTLEITVVHPLRVYAGVEVCQIKYDRLEGESTPYRGKYVGQRGPRASMLWKDFLRAGAGAS